MTHKKYIKYKKQQKLKQKKESKNAIKLTWHNRRQRNQFKAIKMEFDGHIIIPTNPRLETIGYVYRFKPTKKFDYTTNDYMLKLEKEYINIRR